MVNTRSALLEVTINGELHRDMIPEDLTLLKYIRDYLGLTGTKCACNSAECGSCTVIVDGRAVYSCSMLAMQAYGRQVTTIEGLEQDGVLDPIQSAYIEAGAVHCGFCTPGFIMSTKALAGNLCRCTGYVQILDAVKLAAKKLYGSEVG